jgi:flagellar motor switch protein FliN/FliY
VRDIVALRPGSVVELDRAAGSPVDVLVNGALVWHGEVVIVDDEFGIRVAEIVVDEN